MARSPENSRSNSINQFIDDLINFDQGFSEIPFNDLFSFAGDIQSRFGKLPTPIDDNWEEVFWLFSVQFIDDPDNSHE